MLAHIRTHYCRSSKAAILPAFLAAAIYLLTAAAPALAESQALGVASEALKNGKFAFVVKTIDKALKTGGLDTKDMSRALLYRGLAYQSLNKSAQSIADLTNAVWMGGLTQSEKAEALRYRAKAFDAGGISERAKADKTDAARLASGLAKNETLVGVAANQVKTASKPKGGFGSGVTTGISDFFGNIIPGSSSSKPKVAAGNSATVKAPAVTVPTVIAKAPAVAAPVVIAKPRILPAPAPSPSIAIKKPPVVAPPVASTERVPATTTRSAASIAASKARDAARDAEITRQTQIAASPSTSNWSTDVNPVAKAPAQKTNSGSGLGLGGVSDFFGNIFGGSSKSTSVQKQVAKPVAPAPATAPKPTRTAALDVRTTAPKPAPRVRGAYKLQVATVRSKEEATTILDSLSAHHSSVVARHPARVEEAVVGNMGTFYRVRLEAFESKKTALKTCNKLRASGLDCFPVAK